MEISPQQLLAKIGELTVLLDAAQQRIRELETAAAAGQEEREEPK